MGETGAYRFDMWEYYSQMLPKGKENFLSVTCPFKMSPLAYVLQLVSSVKDSNASWVPLCQEKKKF